MRILAVGGGSGGHVTPVVAVLREIKSLHPKSEVRFWCDRKFVNQAQNLVHDFDKNIPVQTIFAGKFRRYHHLSIIRQLVWFSVVLMNLRDLLFVILGFFQSVIKLIIWRPNVVFCKGGYVCLPVGTAAFILRIPLVIHDSDAHPGLTNRILSKLSARIATGAPLEYYDYPVQKSKYVGIPISRAFHEFSASEKVSAKKLWNLNPEKPVIVVTGGGLGASRINDAVVAKLDDLLKIGSVVLVSGENQYEDIRTLVPENSANFQLHAFVSKNMAQLMGAADVIVARAGATTILELAALAKPTILVPNGRLSGGHQLKNAAVYKNADAVEVIDESKMELNPAILVDAVSNLINDKNRAQKIAQALHGFAKPDAAAEVAEMILSVI